MYCLVFLLNNIICTPPPCHKNTFVSSDFWRHCLMLVYDIPLDWLLCAQIILNESEENSELNMFPCKPPSWFSWLTQVIFFWQLVPSTKCWLDFQLLNIGIRTGVIVFYKLSSSYILCIGLFVYFPNFPDNFRNGSEVSLLLHVLFVLYFICNSEWKCMVGILVSAYVLKDQVNHINSNWKNCLISSSVNTVSSVIFYLMCSGVARF